MDEINNWKVGNIVKSRHDGKLHKIISCEEDRDRGYSFMTLQGVDGTHSWEFTLYLSRFYENLGPAGKGYDILWFRK